MHKPSCIKHNILLADKTWFATGGPAQYYAEPTTLHEFQAALVYAQHNNLPVFMLGEGANILISDAGYAGLVIRPQLNTIVHEKEYVIAQAGVSFADLITYCLEHQLLGLEEFSGIPGTVGGSVFINIHYFQYLLSNFLVGARVIHKKTGAIKEVDNAWFNFGYDYSTLHKQEYYLFDATFKLTPCDQLQAAYARGRSVEIIRHRNNRYPNKGTCGSFFRNFHNDEVTLVSNGKKMIYVAYYLDKIGIKGQLSIGDACVSYQHANMIVNQGNATSTDIISIARAMQEKVWDHFNVLPQPECQLIGFEDYPLLTVSSEPQAQHQYPPVHP